MSDLIDRQAAIDALEWKWAGKAAIDAIKKLPSAQPEQRWIPCSERLPDKGQIVLWCNEYGSVFTSTITARKGDSWAIGKRHRSSEIIAWMPLPEPYRKE